MGRYFPEIIDEQSSYLNLSPLTSIIQDLRRKNVVTAAAASGPQMSLLDSSDPWGSSESLGVAEDSTQAMDSVDYGNPCSCQTKIGSRRRMSWTGLRYGSRTTSFGYSSPPKVSSNYQHRPSRDSDGSENGNDEEGVCPECGKVKGGPSQDFDVVNGMRTKSPRQMRLSSWLDSMRTERLESPEHAEALLQATPQLRILSQASTDMQGSGVTTTNNILSMILASGNGNGSRRNQGSEGGNGARTGSSDYRASLVRDRANQQAAAELSSLLWVLAHEMSLEEYGSVESEVFTSVFALVHSPENERRMAGLSALDALIDAPSADEEKKAIKFANTLSNGLRSAHGDYEFLSAVSKALGHMATRTANVDFVESEVTRALEWLRTDRSDRRLAACLALKELAVHAPTTFYSKTSQSTLGQGGSNEFLDYIFEAVRDPQPIVRACAADALSQCLKILMDRQHLSLTGLLCQVHFSVMEGFVEDTTKKSWSALNKVEATQHGSLLVISTMIAQTRDFMLPRYDEVCRQVMEFSTRPKALMQLEVIRLLPRLARRDPRVFSRRYLEQSLDFLLESASNPAGPPSRVDLRPSAFSSIGLLVLAMSDTDTGDVLGGDSLLTVKIVDDPEHPGERRLVELSESGIIYQKLDQIFELVSKGLRSRSVSTRKSISEMHIAAFHCAADLVEALREMALPYIPSLIDDMFRAGLSNDLIQCLHAISECVPEQQSIIEDRLLQEVSMCLAGMKSAKDACDSIVPSVVAPLARTSRAMTFNEDELEASNPSRREAVSEMAHVKINSSHNAEVVNDLVLSLQTLGSFGDSLGRVTTSEGVVPLLPFVQKVAAQYLSHPSSEVRRAAALTCCTLLVPPGIVHKKKVGGFSARIIEDVIDTLLRSAVSDPSPVVRLCVVRALDSRYDPFLCQAHHLQPLFLLLQDELLATRAAGVQLIGRLATRNPAPILSYMRKFLLDLIVELECGVDTGRGREEATRLLVVFLRSKSMKRLVHPVLPALVESLPLNGGTPRLASAALEALGELAKAAGASLQPWVKELVPNILVTLQDQSSASKQRTSLRTLSLIAGSTGYVIQPYIDYPKLLSQATDILPGTKRAPWALRREVIRTLGVLGALDPDRYHTVAPKTRKGGAVGGAYFVVQDDIEAAKAVQDATESGWEIHGRSPFGNSAGAANIQAFGAKISSSSVTTKGVSSSFAGAGRKPQGNVGETHVQVLVENDDDLPAHLSMYEQYAMVAQPVSSLPPARRMAPDDEEFYPTVAIQALMRIFKDPSLAVHHGMVMQAIMFIFKSLGLRCVPFLSQVAPHIMLTIRTCGPSNLRESLLKQVATLSGIVREHLRPYVADIFDIVEQFWSSRHLGTIFSLVLHIAVGVPDEFRKFVPRLIRRILTTLDEMQVADWDSGGSRNNNPIRGLRETERLRLILRSVRSLRGVLGDYLHVLIPALLKLSDSLVPLVASRPSTDLGDDWVGDTNVTSLTVLTLQTISALLECEGTGTGIRPVGAYWGEKSGACIRSGSLSARVVQPLIRLLGKKCQGNKTVGMAIVETLCVCAKQLGRTAWMQLYHQVCRLAIQSWQQDAFNEDPGSIQTGMDSFPASDTDMRIYDEVVHDLQTAPLQRSYNNPFLHDDIRAAQRQDSLMMFGGESLQPMFNENPSMLAYDSTFDPFDAPVSTPYQQSSKQKINQAHLQRAWDVSQCASRDDWDEWMRRVAIQLMRDAPSPALRAAASLAHAYQPLARELFSAAFVCCWKDLSEPYRVNLVHALETAFVADVSPEILQTLLNLAEFMEHDDDDGLPIDIPILADLALKCRAYAKALHYKEREQSMGGSSSCVEALISVNRKLDLPEAALGVLKSATMRLEKDREDDGDYLNHQHFSADFVRQHQTTEMFYSVVWSTQDRTTNSMDVLDLAENKELWLAKLGSWTEALEVYEEKLSRNPSDFDAIVGCMRCLNASGEWRRVLELAEDNWPTLIGNGFVTDSIRQDTVGISLATNHVTRKDKRKAIRMCADAAWRLGRWDDLEKFSSELVHGQGAAAPTPTATGTSRDLALGRVVDFDGAFFSAVLHIHRNEWNMAATAIDAARRAMDSRFTALMAESYNRAYPSMVTAQTLAEMEEIIEFKKIETASQGSLHRHPANTVNSREARERLLSVWRERLAGCRVDADVHSSILAVRSLVLGPTDEVDATLTLSELSRQAQRFKLAERVLLDPLDALGANMNGPTFGFGLAESLGLQTELEETMSRVPVSKIIDDLVTTESRAFLPQYDQRHDQWSKKLINETGGLERLKIQHRLYFAFLKHLWLTDRREEAMERLSRLADVVDLISHCEPAEDNILRAECWLELGEWKVEEMTAPGKPFPEQLQIEVLCEFKRAIMMDNCGYKAWHAWALVNFRLALQINEREEKHVSAISRKRGAPASLSQKNHAITAIRAFVKAISLGTKRWSASVQQDMLNFLTCLFRYGEQSATASIINECVETVAIDTWLGVLPQLLARIHIKSPSIRSVLHPLLIRLGEKHPQALIYPLSVLLKSPVAERKAAAEALMNSLRSHSSALVEEALVVSSELIRVAILWLETWHEGLEEASRLYFGEGNVAGMLDLLIPLHEKIERGADTRRESDFINSFGQDLAQAHQHIKDYIRLVTEGGTSIPTGSSPLPSAFDPSGHVSQNEEAETALNKAWDIYYTVFRRINKQLPALTKLELNHCSPALSRARSLELGVPGTYRVDGSYVKIEKFITNVQVITSKQRPRKISIRGSDGKDYVFLLKGHEDLRQDERVMQLFGLVNALLERDRQTKKHDLRIQRYAISPLSHNCGLVGWVPHTDTLHSLIRDYRNTKKTPLNLEHREMLKLAPDYDMLTVMQKVEVFTDALKKTTGKGNDLYEILWLKSTNSEEWLERRTKFTRSLAVMSMVGYILGLGDRHPSNLMLDKLSGRVLHIDFGDCFEVAMMRDKYPEKVPFRLTRMLIKAMEVSGIEGSYRSTCERTMTVLRESRDSLVAMLEAFVYDPLISWRLVGDVSKTENEERISLAVGEVRGAAKASHNPLLAANEDGLGVVSGVPIDLTRGRSSVMNAPITEGPDEDGDEEGGDVLLPESLRDLRSIPALRPGATGMSATRARSKQMYENMQKLSASLNTDARIASIAGDKRAEQVASSGSIARSRIERSIRQREVLSLLDEEGGLAHDEALNEKALKVIRRVQDKLAGTDFPDPVSKDAGDPLDVVDQVQRLIVQATSVENLCQLFIGWCAFW